MFHIAGYPWKPGYVILGVGALLYLTTLQRPYFRSVRLIFVLAAILMISTAIGSLVFEYQSSVVPSTATFRMMAIYGLIPMSFLVGVADRRTNDNFILWTISAFAVLNIIILAYANSFDWLANFYHLTGLEKGDAFGRGVRIPGSLGNPNITSLMATILLIYFVVGYKNNTIKITSAKVALAIAIITTITVLMISRNQMIAVGIIISSFLIYLPKSIAIKVTFFLVLLFALLTLVLITMGSDKQEQYLKIKLTASIQHRLAQSGIGGSGGFESFWGETGLARPFRALEGAADRWEGSVIVGTGLEAAEGFASPNYHNDWATILASAGIIGLISYALLVMIFGRLEWLLVIPFFLPGTTNAFIFAPQHVVLLTLLAGLVAGRKLKRGKTVEYSQELGGRRHWLGSQRRSQKFRPHAEHTNAAH